MQKRSSSILQFLVLYSADGQHDPLFITNYAIINVLDELCAHTGRRPGDICSAKHELLDADLVRHAAAHQPQSHAVRRHRGNPNAERPGTGRPHRRAADQRRPAVSDSTCRPRAGSPPSSSSAISCCAPIRTVRCCASATSPASRWARRATTAKPASTAAPRWRSAIYLAPGANAVTTAQAVAATLQRLSKRFPAGLSYLVQYDSTSFRDATRSRRCCARWARPSSWS